MGVREATVADAWAIARVHVDSWQTTYRGLLPDEFLDGLIPERRGEFWKAELAIPERNEIVYVAEEAGGKIVGFASGGPERTGVGAYRGELYAIYLIQSRQRRGWGKRLTAAVAGWLLEQSLESMLVWVVAQNQPARRFYEALGGVYVSEKSLRIADVSVLEVSYGWPDLRAAPWVQAFLPGSEDLGPRSS